MKYLLNSVHQWRVPTVEAVEELHQELLDNNDFQLIAFSYKTKQIKVKGEIVEEYQVVTAKLLFDDEKEPERNVTVNYEVQ